MAKIAKKNKVLIGINLDEIINSDKLNKAQILARIKQNIMLCNKNKIKMTFISKQKKDKYDNPLDNTERREGRYIGRLTTDSFLSMIILFVYPLYTLPNG